MVKELIEAGADVNVRATVKRIHLRQQLLSQISLLSSCQLIGHPPVVAELIKAGADVNVPISEGATPLYVAASNGHEACALALIQAGADVSPKQVGLDAVVCSHRGQAREDRKAAETLWCALTESYNS